MDPYTPPVAAAGAVAPALSELPVPTKIDIGEAFTWARSDPDWLKKCAIVGLCSLIPIAGMFVWFGFMRQAYQAAHTNATTLPEFDFGKLLSDGIQPFVAMLNLMVPMFIIMVLAQIAMVVVSVFTGVMQEAGLGDVAGIISVLFMLVIMAVWMLAILGLNLLAPEIFRRGFNGENFPILSPGVSFRAIKSNVGAFVMVFVGAFVANLVGSLGAFACYIGMFLTLPFGMVVYSHILAQWNRMVMGTALTQPPA